MSPPLALWGVPPNWGTGDAGLPASCAKPTHAPFLLGVTQ